jgi:thiol-disulfide isomerase/thioredoxin
MIRLLSAFLLLLFMFGTSLAQEGYNLKVKIKNFEQDSLFLGFYYGEKQYLKDTATLVKGIFEFNGEESLKPGTYLLILPPDNAFVQLNVNANNQFSTVEFDANDPVNSIKIKGDKDNESFYAYVRFLNELRPRADELRKALEDENLDEAERNRLNKELEQLNESVKAYQLKVIEENPGTITSLMINSYLERPLPEFPEIEDKLEKQRAQYRYYMDHYFDGIDFENEGLIRTSFFFPKINDFVLKHTIQIPDSINRAIDVVLEKLSKNEEAHKFFLVHFVNHFAKSNIIGMDAVYVHLVDNYYAKGAAPWIDAEQLEKMTKNAASLRPILIGKIAPDIRMERQDGTKVSLHEMDSPYTVLMFWSPDCGHCKKAMPSVLEFYEEFKDKGVTMFSVCTRLTDKVPECWKMVEEKGMNIFLNVADPYHQSKFSILYDVKTTPQIFIMDAKKEILMKRIAAEQLSEVMSELMERKQQIEQELK